MVRMKRDYLMTGREVRSAALRESISNRGYNWTGQMLLRSFAEGVLAPEDIPLLAVAEATGAADVFRRNQHGGPGGFMATEALTQEEAVSVTAFANITGQIIFTMIKDGFMEADQGVWEALVRVHETPFNGEKIPRMGEITDEEFEVQEGMPFPQGGFGENYIETPITTKRGQIVSVTKEAVFFDRTGGKVGMAAASVGRRLATGRLKRMIDTICGATDSYSENGTAYNTYQTAGTLWTNKVSKGLVDYTDIDEAMAFGANITDPETGNPIEFGSGATLIVPPALKVTARNIVNATSVRTGNTATAGGVQMETSNPIGGDIAQVVSSAFLRARLVADGLSASQADQNWFFGFPKQAFAYMQNWGLTVVQAPANNPDEFHRDVAASFKASERGTPAVIEPRKMLQFTH